MAYLVRKRVPGESWRLMGRFIDIREAKDYAWRPADARPELIVEIYDTTKKKVIVTSYPNVLIDIFSVSINKK